MSLVAVLNSQPEVQSLIESAVGKGQQGFVLTTAHTSALAMDVLSFDLPEIVLWNATDPELDPAPLLEGLQNDSWMHNFGIVALYDPKLASEIDVNDKLQSINVVTVLPLDAIGGHLIKHLRILDANRQILVHLQLGEDQGAKTTGSFNIDNDPSVVPVYAGLAAQSLVQRGYLPAFRKRDLQLALAELVQNGIEHGHCGITSDEKTAYLNQGGHITELIQSKLDADPGLSLKKVTLEWEIRPDSTRFFIRDQGEGFDVMAYLDHVRGHRLDELSGRGIRLARKIGGKLSYNRRGNVACLKVEHDGVERVIPRGFEADEVVVAQRGDVVFRQGEFSDHIFYITSGQFGVYHQGVPVGLLTPADVFMGEMSFLMNNMRTATVVCETPGRLVKIPRRSFVQTLRQYPQYGLFLAKLMARKLSLGNEERSQKVLSEMDAEALV